MPNEDVYISKLKTAYETLMHYSRAELLEIRRSLERWDWPTELGDPPVENWDNLLDYRRTYMPENTVISTTNLRSLLPLL